MARPGGSGPPVGAPPPVYRDPFRQVRGLSFGRVDQGVDYGGSGPVYALGPGEIVNLTNSGWPGNGFIVEKMTAGPAAGSYVYVAEDISPSVRVGQKVDSSTVIGNMNGSIETGYATGPPYGFTLAHNNGHTSFPTPEGQSYFRLLQSVQAGGSGAGTGGAGTPPGGTGNTATGSGGGAIGPSDPNCLIGFGGPSLPVVGQLGSVCLFTKSEARALIGGAVLLVAAGIGALAVGLLVVAGLNKSGAFQKTAAAVGKVPGGTATAGAVRAAAAA